MQTWVNACSGDLRRFKAIHQFLKSHPKLIQFLFQTHKAELRESPESLINRSTALSTGERALIRVALDIWSGSGDARINDLDALNPQCFKNVILGLLIAHGFQPE